MIAVLRAPAFLLTLGGAAVLSAVVARASIVTAIPQTAVLYRAAGLPVHLGGLAFREATSTIESQDGQPVLVVQGRIDNVARAHVRVPPVAITLRGRAGEAVYRWTVPAASVELAVGEGTTFRGRLAAPPGGAVDVELAFADRGQAVASGPR